MDITQFLIVATGVCGGLVLVMLGVLFWVSRKSQRVMESVLTIMTRPERAKIADATRTAK